MDYGFAPRKDRPGENYHDSQRKVFDRRRPNTRLIHRPRVRTVRQFILQLNSPSTRDTTGAPIVKPVGDLLIGAHANSQGWIGIPMFPGQKKVTGTTETNFETLEATLSDPAHSIEIPAELIAHHVGDPITHFLHLKGCNIGKARPYLVKLREALGDHVNVTAPKHFHGLTPRKQGVFEWMAYEFVIRRKGTDAFRDKADAIEVFQREGFERLDSAAPSGWTAVPPGEWMKWIPEKITHTSNPRFPVPLGIAIGARKTIETVQAFRVERAPFTYKIWYPQREAVPVAANDRLRELEQSLRRDPLFFDGVLPRHAYPWFERLGYPSFADFLAGYDWGKAEKWDVIRCKNRERLPGWCLICRGTRILYTVVVPITDPATGNLIFNFYRNPGFPHDAIPVGLSDGDSKYFETV